MAWFVKRSTMEAAIAAERKAAGKERMTFYAMVRDAMNRAASAQQQMTAWITNSADGVTAEQMAQMFWAWDDTKQAAFFNVMQSVVEAEFGARTPNRNQIWGSVGCPSGEGQWYHMAEKLDASGRETLTAMQNHSLYHSERLSAHEPTPTAPGAPL